MKEIRIITTILLLMHFGLNAQQTNITFTYDDAGNRTAANLVIMLAPDDDPVSSIIEESGSEMSGEVVVEEEQVKETDKLSSDMFHLYPNPTSDYVHIRSKSYEGNLKVEIMDTSGKRVGKQTLRDNSRVDMTDYAVGTYYLIIKSEDDRLVYKVIKN